MAITAKGNLASWKKFSAAFSNALMDCGEQITAFAARRMTEESENWLRETDAEWPHSTTLKNGAKFGGDRWHPWYYGHLHDSIATRIAQKNKTISIRYMPEKASSTPQHTSRGDGSVHNRIIGAEWARQEIANAEHVFLPGLQAQLIVGVPYARKVNESSRHTGFLEELNNQFAAKIEEFIYSDEFSGRNRSRIFKPRK